jgi:shikimate O-hydroxycinnamoyltransferase
LIPRALRGGFDVHCDNQGAVFVEARSPLTLDQLLTTGDGDVQGSAMYQPSPVWKSMAPDPNDFEQESKPLLFTQVTRMSCGGAVLAVLLHHLVADGAAQSQFVKAWAELARGEEISASPHLDRSRMQARTPPNPSFEHIEYVVHKQALSFSKKDMAKLASAMPPMTSRIFEFLPEDIEVLKERASADGGASFTGFQVLAGHLWKHITQARGIGAAEVMKLGWAVDGRKRFDPPLPPTYFGNVNFYGCVKRKAGDVMAESLRDAASSIQSATQRITHDYMQSALDLVEVQASPALVTASFIGPADLAITSWVHVGAYQVDFGCGPPVFFTPGVYGFVQLVILLPHPRGDGAVNALIGMFEPHMQALLTDRDFYPLRQNSH